MIETYSFGNIRINGKSYSSDVKIIGEKVVSNWWRKTGHVVDVDDVTDILNSDVEILVVGMGQPGLMKVSPALKSELKNRGIELIEKPTAEAYVEFNRLHAKGKKVAGAFHLTC